MGTTGQEVEYWKLEEDVEEEASSLKCRTPRTAETEALPAPAPSDIHDDDQLILLPPQGEAEGALSQQLQSERSIYFDTNDGIWKCHHCTWTYGYAISENGDTIQNPKAHCSHGVVNVPRTLVLEKNCFSLDTTGTEVNNGTGGVKFSVDGHSVLEKKLVNGESDFTTNGVDILKTVATESTNGTSGMNNGAISISVGEKKLGNGESDSTANGVDNTKSVAIEINNQLLKISNVEKQSGIHFSHSIKSSENGNATFRPDDRPNLELVQEGIQEVAEWDVERVIDEQETHDLFCPNCHSCITKRVILRKRKRNLQILQNDTKREKIEVRQSTLLATNNQAHETNTYGLDGSTPSGDNTDQERVEDRELFRCLSCFSFFIPSVASFKSFWNFGNKGEGASVQNYQEVSATITALRQGEDEVQHVEEVGIRELKSQDPPSHQSNEVSLVTPVPTKSSIQPANNAASVHQENGKNYVVSYTSSVMLEVVKTGVEETPHGAVTKNKGGEDEVQHVEEVGIRELKSQDLPSHQSNEVSLVTPVPTKSSILQANNAASVHQENGKNYVVSSTSSVMLEVVKTGVEETPHGAVTKNKGDDDNNTFSSLPTPYPLPVDSHANEQAEVPSEKHWNDDQNCQVSSSSISVHLVETRVDTSKRIDGGYNVMQDQRMGNLLNPLAYMEKNLPNGNNGTILNQQGAQLPGIFNTRLEEFRQDVQAMSLQEGLLPLDNHIEVGKDLEDLPMSTNSGKDVILLISSEVSQNVQRNADEPMPGISTSGETAYGASRQVDEATISNKWDILKSIVYGGLVESITSLAVVSSAAGGDATTLNIVALGLANLFGGLFIIVHNLMELKNEPYGGDIDPNTTVGRYQEVDRYQELLGKRTNFTLHAIVVLLSYVIFGLIAPVTYGFSFRKSDNKDYKLIVVAAAALVCIILLAVGKTYVRKAPKAYSKTIVRYLCIGVMSSGLSYVAGTLIRRLLQNLGMFDSTVVDPVSPPSAFLESMAAKSSGASY